MDECKPLPRNPGGWFGVFATQAIEPMCHRHPRQHINDGQRSLQPDVRSHGEHDTHPVHNDTRPHVVVHAVSQQHTKASPAGVCRQGLTLVHFSAQHKHILWDTLGA